ncbi:hypothetical protein [Candidatus Endomicrobiellum trichonymphae]|uniref:hypothetical protein n=1 Tax=Endomicrobium trichonymphae TaxID=1408204 RepID=UPI000BBABD9C|nr:hypothetical protein [Candidatus Endomicrobium trichonymphae]
MMVNVANLEKALIRLKRILLAGNKNTGGARTSAAPPKKKSKKEAAFWAQNNKRSFLLHIRMLIDVIIPVRDEKVRGLKSFKRFIDDDIGYTVVKV